MGPPPPTPTLTIYVWEYRRKSVNEKTRDWSEAKGLAKPLPHLCGFQDHLLHGKPTSSLPLELPQNPNTQFLITVTVAPGHLPTVCRGSGLLRLQPLQCGLFIPVGHVLVAAARCVQPWLGHYYGPSIAWWLSYPFLQEA